MHDLGALAGLIRQKNTADAAIAALVGRPALIGHVGEFIAAVIFDIELHATATKAGSDGYFRSGTLASRSVNIKWYGKHESLLDVALKLTPDFYLVLTGPRAAAVSSRGGTRPWLIHHVFLFESEPFHRKLEARGVKMGVATSVTASAWEEAEVYPSQKNPLLRLTESQSKQLELFR